MIKLAGKNNDVQHGVGKSNKKPDLLNMGYRVLTKQGMNKLKRL